MSSAASQSTSQAQGFERITEDGTEYLVAPVVAHQEGVYLYPRENGAGVRREFLPAEEIANVEAEWEGTPLTLPHPERPDGTYGLLDDPTTEATIVGDFRNPRTHDSKLAGQVWIRADEVGEHDGLLESYINAIEAGRHGEVSTGYRADVDVDRGTHEGDRYDYIQVDLEPDHLALLPTEEGNCSVADGCGLGRDPSAATNVRQPVAADGGIRANHRTILNVRSEARTPEFDDTETTSWEEVEKTLSAFLNALDIETDGDQVTVDDLNQEAREEIASLTLLGEVEAETARELMMFPVVNPRTGQLNEGGLDGVIGGRGHTADIPEDAYQSAAQEARRLLEEEFDRDVRDNAALYTHTFGTVGGTFDEDEMDGAVETLNDVAGVTAIRTSGTHDPGLHVVVDPAETDDRANYRSEFESALESSPFAVGNTFDEDGTFQFLPGGESASTTNVGVGAPSGRINPADEGLVGDGRSDAGSTESDVSQDEGLLRGFYALLHRYFGDGDGGGAELRADGSVANGAPDVVTGDGDADGDATGSPGDGTGNGDDPADTGAGQAGSGDPSSSTDPNDMTDDDTIDKLVDEHGLDRENAEALAGTDCAEQILNWAETAEEDAGGAGGTESPSEPGTEPGSGEGQGAGGGAETEDVDELRTELEELRSDYGDLRDEVEREKRERENNLDEQLQEHTDLEDDDLEEMPLSAKESMVNTLDVDDEEETDEDRYNMAGVPGDFDAEVDAGGDAEVPVAGRDSYEDRQGGD